MKQQCCWCPSKCSGSRWKPAAPCWLSTTPPLQPHLHAGGSITALCHLAVPKPGPGVRQYLGCLVLEPGWSGDRTAGEMLGCSCSSADRSSLKDQNLSPYNYGVQTGCGEQSSDPAVEMPWCSRQAGCKLLTSGQDSRSFLWLPRRLQHFHTFPFPARLFPVLEARLISAVSPSAKSGEKWMENRLLASAARDKKTCVDEFVSASSRWL